MFDGYVKLPESIWFEYSEYRITRGYEGISNYLVYSVFVPFY